MQKNNFMKKWKNLNHKKNNMKMKNMKKQK